MAVPGRGCPQFLWAGIHLVLPPCRSACLHSGTGAWPLPLTAGPAGVLHQAVVLGLPAVPSPCVACRLCLPLPPRFGHVEGHVGLPAAHPAALRLLLHRATTACRGENSVTVPPAAQRPHGRGHSGQPLPSSLGQGPSTHPRSLSSRHTEMDCGAPTLPHSSVSAHPVWGLGHPTALQPRVGRIRLGGSRAIPAESLRNLPAPAAATWDPQAQGTSVCS